MNTNPLQNIDLKFRPISYWGGLDKLFSNIKGEWRRSQIKNSLVKGERIPREILQDSLSEELKDYTGRIHPALMGGEYLPNYKKYEVEIARVVYESVTKDVKSIRAKLGNSKIHYRIVDEYDMDWVLIRKSSQRPLALKQIIEMILASFVEGEEYPNKMMIDGTFFHNYYWNWESKEQNGGFLYVTSEFYPQLFNYFEQLEINWLDFCEKYWGNGNELEESDEKEIFKLASGGLADL